MRTIQSGMTWAMLLALMVAGAAAQDRGGRPGFPPAVPGGGGGQRAGAGRPRRR